MDTKIKIISKSGNFLVSNDGQEPTKDVSSIIIERTDKNVEIIKATENNFFDIVRKKFHLN
jgi:hypothetical protein